MITQFGKELRKLRLDLGITLNDMATAISVSPSMLSSAETGKKAVSPAMLDRLASVYEQVRANRAHFEQLAEQTKNEVRIRLSSDNAQANSVALAFARNFDSLDARQIEQLMAVFNKPK